MEFVSLQLPLVSDRAAGEAGHAFHGSEEGELFRFVGDFYDSVIEVDPAVSVGMGKSLVFRTFIRKECGPLGARKQCAHALGEGSFYHDGSLSPRRRVPHPVLCRGMAGLIHVGYRTCLQILWVRLCREAENQVPGDAG